MRAFRRRLRPRGDDGFSLLEAVVALSIAGVIFTALSAATISSVKAVLVGRTVQQSGDVAEQAMESMRAFGYDAVSMKDSDLGVNDPLGLTPTSKYDPVKNVVVATGGESIVSDQAGTVAPHAAVVKPDGQTTFTVRKYVTSVEDAANSATRYKRLTVVVTWNVRGVDRTRILSSLISSQRSGLPLPDYKFASNGSNFECVIRPDDTGVLGFYLENNGARDSWNLTYTGGSTTWTFYSDEGGDVANQFDTEDTPLTNGASGLIGPVETTEKKFIWAVSATTSSSTPLSDSAVTFRATSVAQPNYYSDVATRFQVADTVCVAPSSTASPTATPSPGASETPTPGPSSTPPTQPTTCVSTDTPATASTGGGVTPKTYYMPNGTANIANTTAIDPLTMNKDQSPTSTTLWNYSTDLSASTAGRYLATAGAAVATTAAWDYQFTQKTSLSGNGVVTMWGAPASGLPTDVLGFRVVVERLNSARTSATTIATVDKAAAVWNCAGFKQFTIAVPFSTGNGNGNTTDFSKDQVIRVKVQALTSAGLLAYDTTTFQATTVLPVKSGG